MSFGFGRRRWAAVWIVWLLFPLAVHAQQAGSVDPTFGASLGLAGSVERVLVQPDAKILVAGYFRNGIARLNADGSVDVDFDPDTKTNGPVLALALQKDGKVIVGGSFTSASGVARNGVARLNANGSLDTSFDPGVGTNGFVDTLAVQSDGKVLIAGSFTGVDGAARKSIARLNADGSLDTDFNPKVEVDKNAVGALALQSDGKILIAGNFNVVNGVASNSIARLRRCPAL